MTADSAPVSQRKPASLAAESPNSNGLDPSRILIIDDTRAIHDDFRKILASLQKSGLEQEDADLFGLEADLGSQATFELDSAYQGNEGLALVQRAVETGHCYSMAFVDVRMPPGWNGIETAARLWAVDPDLQIVICTAYSDYSWDAIVKRLGNRDSLMILKKPFDAVEVLQLTHALTKKWQLTRQSKSRFAELEAKVDKRTQELRALNQKLLQDIAQRERAEARLAAFSNLSEQLSAAKTANEAGRIMVKVADDLLGWDACSFALYSAGEDKLHPVLAIDTIEGRRVPCAPGYENATPSALARRTIQEGPQLILKEKPDQMAPGGVPFGDSGRPSASILSVPVRDASKVIGVLSIHSDTRDAYNRQSLETLQSLADHCSGALDRIRAEEALHNAQEQLGHLLRQSPAVIYSLKTHDGINTPSWVSENVIHVVGYSSAECLFPEWWQSRVHPADWDRVWRERTEHSQEQETTLEYRLRHKNGEYRWVRDQRRRVRDSNGVDAEIVGTWVDVTTQKELEEQLRQAQKMEAVGQLAGGVAHDFNNILAANLLQLSLLQQEPNLTPELRSALKDLEAGSNRASNLTRQLLLFSRRQVMEIKPLEFNALHAGLVKMLRRLLGEHIELLIHGQSTPAWVDADAGMMEQVVINLCINARDAMPKGGEITIGTGNIEMDAVAAKAHAEARPGKFVYLSVADTGCGMNEAVLNQIFEPFFTTKEVGKGTGLGLATVYGIVKQHKGWIEVQSEVGVGSVFRVFLPAREAPPLAHTSASANPLSGGKEVVLMVEDNESLRAVTVQWLQYIGYHVLEAANGLEAIDHWNQQGGKVDLLLTDMVMPGGMSGLELAEKLREINPALKTIISSGYSLEIARQNLLKERGITYLAKPYEGPTLAARVRQCLDGA
jgi:PAS domain S-box-containing protein